jgi:hypothetical protein
VTVTVLAEVTSAQFNRGIGAAATILGAAVVFAVILGAAGGMGHREWIRPIIRTASWGVIALGVIGALTAAVVGIVAVAA